MSSSVEQMPGHRSQGTDARAQMPEGQMPEGFLSELDSQRPDFDLFSWLSAMSALDIVIIPPYCYIILGVCSKYFHA